MREFLQVDERLWRGPQPDRDDLEDLKSKGLRAVFNLREEAQHSRALALACGLRYHALPIEDWSVPTLAQVEEFFELVDTDEFAPALVHCWGGVGRTGILVTLYRVRAGMPLAAAIALSDRETPHLLMSQLQRNWLQAHAARFTPA
jgi:protein-tyrosine phosphatase